MSKAPAAELAAVYDVVRVPEAELEADYNTAPTDPVYAILERSERGVEGAEPARELAVARWGFLPHWQKSGGKPLINARVETAHEKSTFSKSMRTRRAILPAAGYYVEGPEAEHFERPQDQHSP